MNTTLVLALGNSVAAWAVCFLLVLAIIIAIRVRRSGGMTLRLSEYHDGVNGESGSERGYELFVQSRRDLEADVQAELYVRHEFGDGAVSGMHGCALKNVQKGLPNDGMGKTGVFRLTAHELARPTITVSAEQRYYEFGLAELKEKDVAVLLRDAQKRLLGKAVLKKPG